MTETSAGATEHLAPDILWDYRETTRSLSGPELLHLSNCDSCLALLAVGYMSTSKEDFEERIRQRSLQEKEPSERRWNDRFF